MKMTSVAMATLVLALGACGGAPESDEASADDAAEHRHLLDAARQPLERARQVEDITALRKEQLNQELETAGDQ